MNAYIIRYLIEYLNYQSTIQKSKANSCSLRRRLRKLILVYISSSLTELIGVVLAAISAAFPQDTKFGMYFYVLSNLFGLTLIPVHCVWVCLIFKLIQIVTIDKRKLVNLKPANNLKEKEPQNLQIATPSLATGSDDAPKTLKAIFVVTDATETAMG